MVVTAADQQARLIEAMNTIIAAAEIDQGLQGVVGQLLNRRAYYASLPVPEIWNLERHTGEDRSLEERVSRAEEFAAKAVAGDLSSADALDLSYL